MKETRIYQKYIDVLFQHSKQMNEKRFFAQQLIDMHEEARKRSNPIIVELGVDRGQSTKVFLNAIDDKNYAHLISVDIIDCGNAVKSKKWEFVQQDSSEISLLVKKKPMINQGIDILYIDSKHTVNHVMKEIYGYYKYIKKDGVIFFDDIDSSPYMISQRKDSVSVEIENRKIFNLLESIFRGNYDKIDFYISRGSTGLAKFVKRNELGESLNIPVKIRERRFKLFWRLLEIFTLKKIYRYIPFTNNSFLVEPNSKNYED